MTAVQDAPFEITEDAPFKLTIKQEEALGLISSEALYLLLYGGSRSTKTFTIVRTIVWRALAVKNSRHAIQNAMHALHHNHNGRECLVGEFQVGGDEHTQDEKRYGRHRQCRQAVVNE